MYGRKPPFGSTYFHWFHEFKEAGRILNFIVQRDRMVVSMSTWYLFKCPCQARKTQAVGIYMYRVLRNQVIW